MTATMLRSSYTISAPTLTRFNALVPAGERSNVIERLMQGALVEREARLGKIAEQLLSDPAFAACREDEVLWDVTAADGLDGV